MGILSLIHVIGACTRTSLKRALPSKLDWFSSTIEAFWEKMGAYGFSMRFGILREST